MGFQWAIIVATQALILNDRGAHSFGIRLMKRDSLASIMNWSKNLYVFMLGALIVFSGCFGTGTTDGEGDADTGTTIINYYNNSTSENEPVWYTSGGTYTTWNDDNSYTDSSGSKNFMRWSNNGSQHSSIDDWNLTECETQGGVARLVPSSSRDSIYCDVTFSTINTSSGEVLKIYQWSNFKLSTTCDGVSEINYQTEYGIPGNAYGNEYIIITGSALNCEHRVWNQLTYSSVDNPKIWSIVYTIQDAIVV